MQWVNGHGSSFGLSHERAGRMLKRVFDSHSRALQQQRAQELLQACTHGTARTARMPPTAMVAATAHGAFFSSPPIRDALRDHGSLVARAAASECAALPHP